MAGALKTHPFKRFLARQSYYVAYAVYALIMTVGYTNMRYVSAFDVVDDIGKCAITLLLVIHIVLNRSFTLPRGLAFLSALGISIVVWRNTGDTTLIWAVVFIATASRIEVKKLAIISVVVTVLVLLLSDFAVRQGILSQTILYRGEVMRSSRGFITPNRFSHALFTVCLGVSVIRYKVKDYWELIPIFASFLISSAVASSRTTEVMLIVLAIFVLINKKVRLSRIKKRIMSAFGLCLAALCIIGSLLAMVIYDSGSIIMDGANEALSGRLEYANYFYEKYSVELLGTDYRNEPVIYGNENDNSASSFLVDNAYCHALLHYGLISSVALFALIILAFWRGIVNSEFDERLFGLLMMILFGLAETNTLYFVTNYFLIAINPWSKIGESARCRRLPRGMSARKMKDESMPDSNGIEIPFSEVPLRGSSWLHSVFFRVKNKIRRRMTL